MNLKLVVVQGKPEGTEIPIGLGKFLIGRGPECHLRPNSELISRHHCLFVVDRNGVTLRDLGSTNGTLVNGVRISGDVIVRHDDLIQVGPLGFRTVVELETVSALPRLEPNLAVAPLSERVGSSAVATPNSDVREHGVHGSMTRSGRQVDPGSDSKSTVDSEDGSAPQNTQVESSEGQDTQHGLPRRMMDRRSRR